jgi:DNA-binding LacI/PurR family transcriptional regulator
MATQHLIDLGHHRIAYVGDKFHDGYGFSTSRERFEGYEKALHDAGIPLNHHYIQLGPFGDETASGLTQELLTLDAPPTAIFAMSDTQALGCITAAREAGWRVPEDLSVIGYDNLSISLHADLSTVDQHLERGGRYGVRYLLAIIDKQPNPIKPALPPLRVIQRGTTAPPPVK